MGKLGESRYKSKMRGLCGDKGEQVASKMRGLCGDKGEQVA